MQHFPALEPLRPLARSEYYICESLGFYNAHPDISREELDAMINEEFNKKIQRINPSRVKRGWPPIMHFDIRYCRGILRFNTIYKLYDEAIEENSYML